MSLQRENIRNFSLRIGACISTIPLNQWRISAFNPSTPVAPTARNSRHFGDISRLTLSLLRYHSVFSDQYIDRDDASLFYTISFSAEKVPEEQIRALKYPYETCIGNSIPLLAKQKKDVTWPSFYLGYRLVSFPAQRSLQTSP